ncbi:molybdopterin-guanine dinucleotide biosynthesis protein B [Methanocalculus chunghsingensis]|uniref:molybdopterin-guanine dinucleotide biosynthesis protein B n=1 Tax=Methanocalculus chunghsingensis TaxID=156457 RepID=UPI001B8CEDE0|nr:molybdopterin-guanine dinucleotide biosynthesis protein B [Methanocalculus chunghsingensis]
MIIIHIFGTSNTGKTMLTRQLCERLAATGHVETIKHLGHHLFTLEEGRDTTVHYQAGASGSCGIDSEKSVTIQREGGLIAAIDAAADRGADFCIIEGYKNTPIPGVALGDHRGAPEILRDPTVDEILNNLDLFPCWTTPKAILDSLYKKAGTGVAGGVLILHKATEMALKRSVAAAEISPDIIAIRGEMLIQGCSVGDPDRRGCLAVIGTSPGAVASALSRGAEAWVEKEQKEEEFNSQEEE